MKEGLVHNHPLPFRTLAAMLCLLMFSGQVLNAAAQESVPPKSLQIVILDGEGALNNIKLRTAHEPIVQVQDENHKPVAGALVLFLLPNSGPGGTFVNGTTTLSVTTDAEGKALARGLLNNKVTGPFQIQVRVKYNELSAQTVINQENIKNKSTNTSQNGQSAIIKWVMIGAAVGVGVGLGVWASQSSHTTTITAGTPTVGAP